MKSLEPEVEAADRAAAEARARRDFALAVRHAWQAAGSAVIACCGLSGSGKTTLAAELVRRTGFVLLGTDAMRRRLADPTPTGVAPYGGGRYTTSAREGVYEALCAKADGALAAGQGVIADATFIRAADRQRLATVARRHRRQCIFVECRADEDVIRARLDARGRASSLSDARWETYLGQRARLEPLRPDEPHFVVDTSGDPEAALCRRPAAAVGLAARAPSRGVPRCEPRLNAEAAGRSVARRSS